MNQQFCKVKMERYLAISAQVILTVWMAALHVAKATSLYQFFLGLAIFTFYLILPISINSVLKEVGWSNGFFEVLVHTLFLINYGYILFYNEHAKTIVVVLPVVISLLFFAVAKVLSIQKYAFGKDAQVVATLMLISCLMTSALPVLKTEGFYTREVAQMANSYINTGAPYPEIEDVKNVAISPPEKLGSLKKWSEMTNEQKIDLLKTIIVFECTDLGISYHPDLIIKSIPITTTNIDQTECVFKTNGFFSNDDKSITLNEELMRSDGKQIVKTLLHELNHAFVYDVVAHIDWSDDYVQDSAFFRDLLLLKQNERQYKRSEKHGYKSYYSQPLEQTARQYSEERFASVYSQFFE